MQFTQKNFHKKLLGKIGEDLAVKHLKKSGYKILERNFTTKLGEADIIAQDGEYIVFVEVKTRENDDCGAPSEAVNYYKRHKYVKVAKEYLLKTHKTDFPCRFDVIEVENKQINHIKDAFCV